MSNIDNQIVSMVFDNNSFEKKLATTLASLNNLRQSLNFSGAQGGLDGIQKALGNVNFEDMESGIHNVDEGLSSLNDKFSVIGVIAASAIQKITQEIITLVQSIGDVTFDTILGGGKSRALNLEQARFLFEGLGLDIEKSMKSALDAVTGTAYGLDVAAKTAAQLGGSGLKAGEEMTRALRGIAGVAGVTNTSFEEMADVFVSAAGKGKVSGYELQRIGQRGLNAAAALAKEWGTTEEEVRRMASEGEISFKKFAEAMNSAFGDQATKANETYTGSLANVKAALSRVGASFFGPYLQQQRDVFVALIPVIDAVGKAIEPLIATFLYLKAVSTANFTKFLGNLDFTTLTYGAALFAKILGNIFSAVYELGSIIGKAFRDIFPKSETSKLLEFILAIKEFTDSLKIGASVSGKIQNVFRGIFSVLAIGIEVVKELALFFFDLGRSLVAALGFNGGKTLSFFSDLGLTLRDLKESLVDGGGIADFFDMLREKVGAALDFIPKIREAILGLFDNKVSTGISASTDAFARFGQRLGYLQEFFKRLGKGLDILGERLKAIGEKFAEAGRAIGRFIGDAISDIKENVENALKPGDFNGALDAVNIGLLGGLGLLIRKFFKDGLDVTFSTGIIDTVVSAFGSLQETLVAIQLEVKARVLIKIAYAVAILAASMVVLSLIDSVALTKALTAMATGFGLLVGAMTLLGKQDLGVGALQMNAMSAAIISLAVAALILSVAITVLSKLSWEELAKGLIGVSVALVALSGATRLIANDKEGMVKAGISMIFMSIGLVVLASAVKKFGALSWGELAKGLIGIWVGLELLVGALNRMDTGGVFRASIAMGILAASMLILAEAVKAFATIPLGDMAKGFAAIAVGLLIITGAMNDMPEKKSLSNAAALLIVSAALLVLAEAVQRMGAIKMGDLAKGIGGLAAVLIILSGALILMNGTIGGAAALVVASGALVLLAEVLKTIGGLSIASIAVGLLTITLALALLFIAGIAMGPVVPVLLGLGQAMLLLGLGFAAFGAGAALLAKAFQLIAQSGKAGLELVTVVIEQAIKALPRLIAAIATGLVEAASVILASLPELIDSVGLIILTLFEAIKVLVPVVAELIGSIISAATLLLAEKGPELIHTFLDLFTILLEELDLRLPRFVQLGSSMIVSLLQGLSDNAEAITNAAVDLLLKFLSTLESRAVEIVTGGLGILIALLKGIGDNIFKVAEEAAKVIVKFIEALSQGTQDIIDAGFKMIEDVIGGISDNVDSLIDKGVEAVSKFIEGVGDGALDLANAAADALVDFLEGLEYSIKYNAPRIRGAAGAVARAFIDGLTGGLLEKAENFYQEVRGLADTGVDILTGKWLVKSPSRLTHEIGKNIVQGLANGIKDNNNAEKSLNQLSNSMISGLNDAMQKSPKELTGIDFNPVIRPVLDLTEVARGAKALDGLLMGDARIAPDVSYAKAKDISTTAEITGRDTETTPQEPTELTFIQNNYSPKALSTKELYKNTKGQISMAKEEIGVSP